MDRREYGEFCALAVALDHLGERWTLLVIRELLLGPKRYTDLRAGLPGIAANLLAARLKTLEADGLVSRRRLPPPAASTIYELTSRGRDLEPALLTLMRWGSTWMTRPAPGSVLRASWFALALKSLVLPQQLKGIRADFELATGAETIHVRVADGAIEVREAGVETPDARLTTDAGTMFAIAAGRVTLAQAITGGRAKADGTPARQRELERTLAFPR